MEFHNIVCFGKLADIFSRYLKKGSLVLIEGRIQTRSWTDNAGAKKYKTEIVAELMQMGPKGSGGGEHGGSGSYEKPSFARNDSPAQKTEDIPVIEENYTPPANEESADQKNTSFQNDAPDEIDVKDIPF